jgi:hypothetical protein
MYSYIVKVRNSLGDDVYVGPFDNKIDARLYLGKATGSRQGGLPILVLAPQILT